jgi:hypothetical protein
MRHKSSNKTKRDEQDESTLSAERENGSATTPAHLEMTVETSPDSDRRTRKKHAYKRKPQSTRLARPSEDLRQNPSVDQSAFVLGAWPLLSLTTNPQSRVHRQ